MPYLGRRGASAALTTADIPDNSITAAKIVDATILAGDLAPDSVDSSELVDGSIDTSHLADDAVTGAKIENNPTIGGILTAPSLVLTPGTAPATTEGAIYYDSTSNLVKVYKLVMEEIE